MIIKALYVILILSTVVVIGVAIALYVRVRRHMSNPVDPHHTPSPQTSGPAKPKP